MCRMLQVVSCELRVVGCRLGAAWFGENASGIEHSEKGKVRKWEGTMLGRWEVMTLESWEGGKLESV